jgi:hypothetical protein
MCNDELHQNLRAYFDPPTLTQLPGLRRSASASAEFQSTSSSLKGARRRPSRPDDLPLNLSSAREPKLSARDSHLHSARSYLNSARDGSNLGTARSMMNSARESAPMLSVRSVRSRTTSPSVGAPSVGGKSAMERQDELFWGAERHLPGGTMKNPATGDVEPWDNMWGATGSKFNEFNPALLRTYFPDPAMPPQFAKFKVPRSHRAY